VQGQTSCRRRPTMTVKLAARQMIGHHKSHIFGIIFWPAGHLLTAIVLDDKKDMGHLSIL
jgi:hypothetical protein